MDLKRKARSLHLSLDLLIVFAAMVTLVMWLMGRGPFYQENGPVMSPFTALSLLGLAGIRIMDTNLKTWATTLNLAILGVISCGNLSNILMLLTLPEIFLKALPWTVPTSILTSVGLIIFCLYEILIILRPTPKSFFIVDDILIHLALFPGGLSLLGHLLDSPTYLSSSVDPRVGISLLEMAFMGSYATSAVLANPNLFLWRFLSQSLRNGFIFTALFLNQYVAPTVFGLIFLDAGKPNGLGLEFFIMLAGVLSTLVFLVLQAVIHQERTRP